MKCKICGQRANSLKAMGAHYRKAHPNRMKRSKSTPKAERRVKSSSSSASVPGGARFCKWCGGRVD